MNTDCFVRKEPSICKEYANTNNCEDSKQAKNDSHDSEVAHCSVYWQSDRDKDREEENAKVECEEYLLKYSVFVNVLECRIGGVFKEGNLEELVKEDHYRDEHGADCQELEQVERDQVEDEEDHEGLTPPRMVVAAARNHFTCI